MVSDLYDDYLDMTLSKSLITMKHIESVPKFTCHIFLGS